MKIKERQNASTGPARAFVIWQRRVMTAQASPIHENLECTLTPNLHC